MILTSDLAERVVAALAAKASTLPGGAHHGRGPDTPSSYPYVVFRLEAGEPEFTSGPAYFQKWRVYAAAYVSLGASPAVLDVQKALAGALCVGTTPPTVGPLRNASESVMQALPLYGEEEYEPTLREGRDVLAAWQSAELYCKGDRTLA